MKCYVIYHIHIFEDGNEDYKIIGIFSSYDEALEVKEKYSSELPGFKDFPEGFCIEEFEVTGLDMAKQRTVYVIFTYIYKDGKEYLDIFPLWDWRKLPGVTAFEDNAPMPLIKSYQPRNKGTFVGAVSDEKQGMTVMELDRAGVKAHKAWVCTDDFILCLLPLL